MKKLALFVAHPYCSTQSNNGIVQALESRYSFKLFSKHEIEETFFDDVDGVVFGGGFGDSESFHHLMKHNCKSIKKFVRSGGKYIGICMGGYWAGKQYFNILQGCDTVQYIKRPYTDTRRPHAKDLDVIWNGSPEKMFFYDGFAVTPGDYLCYAKYMNSDAMAIIQNNIGIIGCHPEATQHWYDSYSWMHGKYVSKHNLLLQFVNKVMYDT
jgi:hypothetical protein